MKVKHLIRELKMCSPEKEVSIWGTPNGPSDTFVVFNNETGVIIGSSDFYTFATELDDYVDAVILLEDFSSDEDRQKRKEEVRKAAIESGLYKDEKFVYNNADDIPLDKRRTEYS